MKRLIIAVVVAFFSSHALACTPVPRADLIKGLRGENIGEDVFAVGKTNTGLLVEFFLNEATQTFTVVVTKISRREADGKIAGTSCIILPGKDFELVDPQSLDLKPTKHTMLNIPFYGLQ